MYFLSIFFYDNDWDMLDTGLVFMYNYDRPYLNIFKKKYFLHDDSDDSDLLL